MQCRCILIIENNEWSIKFHRVIDSGMENFDSVFIITSILSPITFWLLDFLLVPYFIARLLCYFTSSYALQTSLVRNSYGTYLLVRVLYKLAKIAYVRLMKFHDEVRDSKYLLGQELRNRLVGWHTHTGTYTHTHIHTHTHTWISQQYAQTCALMCTPTSEWQTQRLKNEINWHLILRKR